MAFRPIALWLWTWVEWTPASYLHRFGISIYIQNAAQLSQTPILSSKLRWNYFVVCFKFDICNSWYVWHLNNINGIQLPWHHQKRGNCSPRRTIVHCLRSIWPKIIYQLFSGPVQSRLWLVTVLIAIIWAFIGAAYLCPNWNKICNTRMLINDTTSGLPGRMWYLWIWIQR